MEDKDRIEVYYKSGRLLDRLDGLLAFAVAGGSLFGYGLTLAPGLLPGDSGEFQTLAVLLGNTHPTGYGVYLILARLFSLVPLGEIAYRVNLFSAVMAAVAIAGVYLLARMISGYRAVAVMVSLALAISPTFWSQAIIAEVYTAGAAFLVLVLLVLFWWQHSGKPLILFLAGLLGGLSLGVHLTVALLAPAAAVLLLTMVKKRQREGTRLAVWRPAFLGAIAGLATTIFCFLLLYWHDSPADFFNSAVVPARSNWGLPVEAIDGPWDQLLFHWSARQFRRFMFTDPAAVMARQIAVYWQGLPYEIAPLLLALALVGLLSLLFRNRPLAWLMLVALAAQWLYAFNYDIWDLYVFHIPSYVLLLVLAGVGAGATIDLLRRLTRRRRVQGWPFDLVLALLMVAYGIWPVLQPNAAAIGQHQVPFRSRVYPVDEYSLNQLHSVARAVVQDLPENAILFTHWDMLYPYYYVAHIEAGRSDLMFIETYPSADRPKLADSILDYIGEHLAERPIFFTDRASEITSAGYGLSSTRIGPLQLHQVRSNR